MIIYLKLIIWLSLSIVIYKLTRTSSVFIYDWSNNNNKTTDAVQEIVNQHNDKYWVSLMNPLRMIDRYSEGRSNPVEAVKQLQLIANDI